VTAAQRTSKRRIDALIVLLAFSVFILLGMPEGMLGVAWPSIRTTFGAPLEALGLLILGGSGAFMLASFSSGRLVNRFGIAAVLILGCLVRSAGLLGYAFAPSWWLVVSASIIFGFGSGLIDAGMNTHFAITYSERLMNWLHASFGIGATMGPLLMTAILNQNSSWRWGYVLVGLAQGAITLAIIATSSKWRLRPSMLDEDETASPSIESKTEHSARPAASVSETLHQPIVWLGVAVFFVYAGLEMTVGQWSYTLFTEGRGVDLKTAGLWVGIYWGSFTVGRMIFGVLAGRWPTTAVVRTMMATAIVSAALIWWNPVDWVSFGGLAMLGLAMAPVFPLLTSATDKRMARRFSIHAVGYQVGAASLGIAIIPGLAGILAARLGLEVIGPYQVVIAMSMFGLHEMLVRMTR
jgi:fucose permease